MLLLFGNLRFSWHLTVSIEVSTDDNQANLCSLIYFRLNPPQQSQKYMKNINLVKIVIGYKNEHLSSENELKFLKF